MRALGGAVNIGRGPMRGDGTNWHANRAYRALATTPLLRRTDSFMALVVADVRSVLKSWCAHCGDARWSSFLNRKSFLHEVEEAITPLVALCRRVDREAKCGGTAVADITVVDVACGKAFFSMLLGGLRELRPLLHARVAKVLLVEKASVDYAHVALAQAGAAAVLEVWPKTNVFDDALMLRLSALEAPQLWLVGIHLCRRLSSRPLRRARQCSRPPKHSPRAALFLSHTHSPQPLLSQWRGACTAMRLASALPTARPVQIPSLGLVADHEVHTVGQEILRCFKACLIIKRACS